MLEYNKKEATTTPRVNGYASIRTMTKKERAQFALAIIEGRAALPNLNKEMIARACGVSLASVNRARRRSASHSRRLDEEGVTCRVDRGRTHAGRYVGLGSDDRAEPVSEKPRPRAPVL
jgi:hypothetical protein